MSDLLVFNRIDGLIAHRNTINASVGFVPTMGALHEGHVSLIERSTRENDHTIVSIFLNPTQFNDKKDLAKYPSNLNADIEILKKTKANILFCPDHSAMYKDNYNYKITESSLSRSLCGKHRPGHFDGVLTVVMKLLQITRPTRAYFGEKDYQQLQLIKEMVEAFFIDTKIIGCPLIRDHDGVALSSRNKLLPPESRLKAMRFAEILKKESNLEQIKFQLEELGFEVDYVEELWNKRLAAVKIGDVRLIDNVDA